MTITFTESGGSQVGVTNKVHDPVINASIFPHSAINITAVSATQINATGTVKSASGSITGVFVLQGSFSGAVVGETFQGFDNGVITGTLKTVSITLSQGSLSGNEVISFSTPVNVDNFMLSQTSVLIAQAIYTGQLIFTNQSVKTMGESYYGYSGYATFTDNSLYSASDNDTFIGGTGGINTLVLPDKFTNYEVSASSLIWDDNSQTSSLSGFVLSNKPQTYAQVQVSNVQRVDFSDGTHLALDINGNAGVVAKILGAVFGASSVYNKNYVGIGLSYIDGGMSESNLVQLALNARFGGSFTDSQEINLLYQNLYGHAPTTQEVSAIDALIKTGQYSQATLGVLAAESTNNAANIHLVGLASTGIEFIPF